MVYYLHSSFDLYDMCSVLFLFLIEPQTQTQLQPLFSNMPIRHPWPKIKNCFLSQLIILCPNWLAYS